MRHKNGTNYWGERNYDFLSVINIKVYLFCLFNRVNFFRFHVIKEEIRICAYAKLNWDNRLPDWDMLI